MRRTEIFPTSFHSCIPFRPPGRSFPRLEDPCRGIAIKVREMAWGRTRGAITPLSSSTSIILWRKEFSLCLFTVAYWSAWLFPHMDSGTPWITFVSITKVCQEWGKNGEGGFGCLFMHSWIHAVMPKSRYLEAYEMKIRLPPGQNSRDIILTVSGTELWSLPVPSHPISLFYFTTCLINLWSFWGQKYTWGNGRKPLGAWHSINK